MTLMKQVFILVSSTSFNFGNGGQMAFPSALLPSLLADNGTDIRASADQVSWIAASSGIAGIPGFIVLPIIMQYYGRKIAHIIANMFLLIGWIIFLFATDTTALFCARIIQGLSVGGGIITCIILAEYSDPTRRGYFMVIKKIFFTAGLLIVHLFVLFWSWRQIAGFFILVNSFGILTTFVWPESPSFLAWKSNFKECEKSFIWLHGDRNRKELDDMISVQQTNSEQRKTLRTKTFRSKLKRLCSRDFFISFLVSNSLTILIETSGRHYFAAYLVEMMTQLIGNKAYAVYISLGNDCMAILALMIACFIIKRFSRRTLLLFFGGLSMLLLFLLSIVTFLNAKFSLNLDLLVVGTILLLTFSSGLGIIPLTYTLFGEIFPLDLRGVGASISGMSAAFFYAIALVVTPFFVKTVGMSGTFAINGGFMLICLILLYFILPETKDRTLLDIENEIKGVNDSPTENMAMIPM